ncbi:type II toxin-antitoxin system TacA family antitoxin [Sphingomonas changnyeongensis]
MWQLTEAGGAVVLEALYNPPAPNERLVRAFADHTRRSGG